MRLRQRRLALVSIGAATLLVVIGAILELTLAKAVPGSICLVFGGVALLLWVFVWPSYKRRGFL